MSHPSDSDRELEAFLARESALQTRWREVAREEPPAQLDANVRAAAHRAVGAAPRDATTGARVHWRLPLAAAATLVLGTTLALMVAEREAHIPDATVERSTQPAPAARDDAFTRESDAAGQSTLAAPEAAKARALNSAPEAKQRPAPRMPAPQLPEPPLPGPYSPAPTSPSADNAPAAEPPAAAAHEAPERRFQVQSLSKRMAPPAPAAEGAPIPEIERLLQQIRTLRDEGRLEEAAQRLREFRERYPDYEVPRDLSSGP